MSLLDSILGNAGEVDLKNLKKELGELIIDEEKIESGYKIFRDYFVFTNKRLILVDKQGVTGKKVEYHSIPYKNIRHFSIESAGTFDRDAELKLWIAGNSNSLEKKLGKKSSDIIKIQRTLAKYILA